MNRKFIRDILFGKKRKLISRSFLPKIFLDDIHHNQFKENGFIHLKNILTEKEVSLINDIYKEIKKWKEFENKPDFNNSLAFKNPAIKKHVREKVLEITKNIFPRFIDTTNSFSLGVAFCISPPHSNDGSRLHQDPTIVNENNSYAFQIWIPLVDMNKENGCLHIIPGSHLWGNIHRQISIHSSLDTFLSDLWEFTQPIPAKAGDIICFDVSTIHGSPANQSDEERVAVNITTTPKNVVMKTYYPLKKSMFKNKAAIYDIDENYSVEEIDYKQPLEKYKFSEIVDLDNYFTYENIKELNSEYNLLGKNE